MGLVSGCRKVYHNFGPGKYPRDRPAHGNAIAWTLCAAAHDGVEVERGRLDLLAPIVCDFGRLVVVLWCGHQLLGDDCGAHRLGAIAQQQVQKVEFAALARPEVRLST
jgi:hypothetical protein